MKNITFSLTKITPKASIKTTSGFKYLQIVASYTAGYWENAYSPFIKFQLQNTKVDFTLRAKENRETKSFNAINILESANQVETLKGEIFTKLTIDGSQSLSLDQTVIKMEIEFED